MAQWLAGWTTVRAIRGRPRLGLSFRMAATPLNTGYLPHSFLFSRNSRYLKGGQLSLIREVNLITLGIRPIHFYLVEILVI